MDRPAFTVVEALIYGALVLLGSLIMVASVAVVTRLNVAVQTIVSYHLIHRRVWYTIVTDVAHCTHWHQTPSECRLIREKHWQRRYHHKKGVLYRAQQRWNGARWVRSTLCMATNAPLPTLTAITPVWTQVNWSPTAGADWQEIVYHWDQV